MVNMLENNQTTAMRESLSALMDDEASEMELLRVLKAVEQQPELRQRWASYQMIAASMRGEVPVAPYVDLSSSISAALEDEPVHALVVAEKTWLHRVGRMAIAASVAGAVIVTGQLSGFGLGDVGSDGASVLAASGAPAVSGAVPSGALPAGFRAPDLAARTVSSHKSMPAAEGRTLVKRAPSAPVNRRPSPEVQAYLQQVMQLHADNASVNTGRGVLSYARVPAVKVQPPESSK